MPPRSVALGHGLQWIAAGWQIFRRNPLVWITLTVTLILIWLVLLSIPKLGPLLFNLLFPVFFAGLMLGCRAQEQGKKLEIGYLFAGFRENAAALVTVGGIYLVGMLIVLAIVFGSSEGLPKMPAKPSPDDVAALQTALKKMTGPILSGMALYVPLMMLTWFAPLLIVFRKMNALPALKASFIACMQNLGAFTLYGVVIVILWIAATLPVFVGLVIVLPVIFGSIYASYVDIFERTAEEPATQR
jgi:uncharacterized membrane protein